MLLQQMRPRFPLLFASESTKEGNGEIYIIAFGKRKVFCLKHGSCKYKPRVMIIEEYIYWPVFLVFSRYEPRLKYSS